MKYWMLLCCLFLVGCGEGPTNVVDPSDSEAIAAYEAAIAEGDKMQASDEEFKE